MLKRLSFLMVSIVLFFSIPSCTTKMDTDQFHDELIELYLFYKHYFESFASSESTAEDLIKRDEEYKLRKKKDEKTLSKMKATGLDDELCILIKSMLNDIKINREHLYKEITMVKSKEAHDLEDTSKLNRFYRDTKVYIKDKEEHFIDLYFKFIRRTEIEPDQTIFQLKKQKH